MSHLYVTEHGGVIGLCENRIEVRYKDKECVSIPIETLEAIEIHGESQVTTHAIKECLRRNIPISFHSGDDSYLGMLATIGRENVFRQKLQVKRSEEEEFTLSFTKKIMQAKVHNQMVILRRYARNLSEEANESIHELSIIRKRIDRGKTKLEIIGCEGYAARYYFKGLGKLVDRDFSFERRSRRPPKDEFNVLLSMGYFILFQEIYAKIEKKGLNSSFGIIHEDRIHHPTLVSDLMEEWRPVIVDSLVMSLVNGHEIRRSHFIRENDKIYLNRDGKKIFINKLESKLSTEVKYLDYISYSVSFREAIDLQIGRFCKCLEKDSVDDYHPILIR